MALRAAAGLLLLAAAGLPAGAADRPPAVDYVLRCSGCHGTDGRGAPAAGIPPFPDFVDRFAALPDGRAYLVHVPGVAGSGLDPAGVARVLNYVLARWAGERAGGLVPFTAAEVAELRAREIADVVAYRRALVPKMRAAGLAVADYPWP